MKVYSVGSFVAFQTKLKKKLIENASNFCNDDIRDSFYDFYGLSTLKECTLN